MTGRITRYTVNVANYVATGREPMKQFETSWPETFYEPLSNKAVTMAVSYKYIKLESADCSDTNLVYLRIMGVYLKYVLSHQLASVATLVFKDNGNMRITKSKSRMKWKLQVEQSSRTMPTVRGSHLGCHLDYFDFSKGARLS